MANLYQRCQLEQTTHSRLLARSQHLETPDEDYRSNAEKTLATKVTIGLERLEKTILQMDELGNSSMSLPLLFHRLLQFANHQDIFLARLLLIIL